MQVERNPGGAPPGVRLDANGLFETPEDAAAFAAWYVVASRDEIVEPLADDAVIDPVGIYVVE